MSYGVASALQAAVYQQLYTDPAVSALVGPHVFDALPTGPVPPLYVALGAERVRDASDQSGGGAWHDLQISVVTQNAGFADAKRAAGAVSDALAGAELTLSRGVLVSLNFLRASAARIGTGDSRRIDLIFRARICDS